jgi:hypothetical protein
MKILPLLMSCLFLVGLPLGLIAEEEAAVPWPEKLAECPDFVKLDREKMKEVDGREAEGLRKRPWPDQEGKIAHQDLVIENLKLHHFCDKKAVMISSGSADKPRVEGQIASYKSITFRNLDIGPLCRVKPGLHMDHLWIGPGHDESMTPDVTIEDVFIHDGNSGVVPILFESGGKWGTLTFRRVAALNVAHPITIKLGKSSFKDIVVEDCPGIRIILQGEGDPVTVHVIGSPGAGITTPRDGQGKVALGVKVVQEEKPTTQPATRPATQPVAETPGAQ